MTPKEVRKSSLIQGSYSFLWPVSLQLGELTLYLRISENVGSHLHTSDLEAFLSIGEERNTHLYVIRQKSTS